MPGGGPHVAAAAKSIDPRLHIVVFSGRADSTIAQAMLAAGADQYVLKTGRVQPLLKAMENAYQQLRSVVRGQYHRHPTRGEPAAPPSHDEHVLDGERCRCGSLVRRRTRH